jgi:hypothetical protein
MSLERKFEKELAGELRKETADKLREVRQMPYSFKDLQKATVLPSEYERPEIKELIEELKKSIFGRIFKTESFRTKESFLSEVLQSEKEILVSKIEKEYEEKFNEILKNCPLTPEERDIYLSTEAMEKMNLDDYLILTKRLSQEAFYHVTRYGVRENTFMSTGGGHNMGKGEFVNNLIPLLKDGRIKDCTTTVLSNKERTQSMVNEEFIKEQKESGKSVEEVVEEILNNYGTDYFLDTESSHFSYGEEKHRMYGGENNYQFYFYYPVEYILQNDFYHSTRESQITIGKGYSHNQPGIKQQYNDFEIFNFGEGVPINAGILCITGDIKVDPKTGSQYLLENGKPVFDESGEFKKPEKTVSSQDYWENYFNSHPDLKPSKILYSNYYTYAGKENPELENWAKSKKIHKQDENKRQEFLDYRNQKTEDLRKIFTEVIQEKFEILESK